MKEIQAVRPDDPYKVVERLDDGRFAVGQWSETCQPCGGKMAHGKLYRIPFWHCEECHDRYCLHEIVRGKRTGLSICRTVPLKSARKG